MFIKLLILSALLLLLAFIFLAIRVLLKPDGRFPETHIGKNREMRRRGITCAKNTDIGCTPADGFPGCPACGDQQIINSD